MGEKTNNTITIPVEKYQAMLETNMDQSMEITKLKNTLKAEYDYAESVLQECDRLNKEVIRLQNELAEATKVPEPVAEE